MGCGARSKLDGCAQSRMFHLEQLDAIATDLAPDDERLDPYRDAVELR